MRKKLLLFVFLISAVGSMAQKVSYGLDFMTFFDNREYNSVYNYSQTFFGTRLMPELRLDLGDGQRLVGGVGLVFDFGAKPTARDPFPVLYYDYKSSNFNAAAGFFPREKLLGFPSLMVYDSISVYSPNMGGFMLQNKGERGFIEAAIDWNGFRTYTQRESFLVLSAGRYRLNRLFGGYHLSYFHYARQWAAPDSQHLVDNGIFHLFAGVDLSPKSKRDSIYIQLGFVQGAQRIRGTENSKSPRGLLAEIYYQYRKVGVKNTLYLGDPQMSNYAQFGNHVYWGDPYYQSNKYDRLELFWNIVQKERTEVKFSSIHHYDGFVWGWQQLLTLRVKI